MGYNRKHSWCKVNMAGARKHKKTVKKGGYYSFNGGLATGAPAWAQGSEHGDFAVNRGGNGIQYGRGRSRGRHLKKKGRKTRRKTMRGGSKYGAVSASFAGQGERGIANYVGANTKGPAGSSLGAFNDNGAHGGNFKSFSGLLPK